MGVVKKFQDWTLYLFAFSLSFEYWGAFGLIKYFSLGALAGYLYFFSILLNTRFRYNSKEIRKYVIPLLTFFLILTIMSLINFSGGLEIKWFNLSIFQCIILFILITLHLSNRKSEVAKNVLLSYAMGSILLTSLFSFGYGVHYSIDMRLSVLDSGPNLQGVMVAVAVLIVLSIVFENKSNYGRIRFLLLLFIPLMLKLISETGSRGAFITLALGLILFIWLIKMRRIYKIIFIVIAIISTAIMVQYMLQAEVLKNRLIYTLETGDTSQRTNNWQVAFQLFLENPIFGIGETGYYNSASKILKFYQAPHNVFLEALVYTGIVGLLCYCVLIYRIYIKIRTLYKTYNFLLPGVLFAMVIALFLNGQGLYIKFVWLLFAIFISLAQSYKPTRKIHKSTF